MILGKGEDAPFSVVVKLRDAENELGRTESLDLEFPL